MLDLSQPVGRRELVVLLQEHALHIARLATTLQQDTPSQIAGSTLVSSAVQALQVSRRFQQEPNEERFLMLAEMLETQATWLELLADAELAQPAMLQPHRERVLGILENGFNRVL